MKISDGLFSISSISSLVEENTHSRLSAAAFDGSIDDTSYVSDTFAVSDIFDITAGSSVEAVNSSEISSLELSVSRIIAVFKLPPASLGSKIRVFGNKEKKITLLVLAFLFA